MPAVHTMTSQPGSNIRLAHRYSLCRKPASAFTPARTGMATAVATPIWARTFMLWRMVASRLLKLRPLVGQCHNHRTSLLRKPRASQDNFTLRSPKRDQGKRRRRRTAQVIATIGQIPTNFSLRTCTWSCVGTTVSPTYWPSSNGKNEAWVKEHYARPSEFINERRKVFVPQKEARLIVVDQESYSEVLSGGCLESGVRREFGQGKGEARRRRQQDSEGYVLRD